MSLCRQKMEHDMLYVRVRLGSSEVEKSIWIVKATLFAQLGIVGLLAHIERRRNSVLKQSFPGGTVGLFSGLSFLAFFEAAFWCLKGLLYLRRKDASTTYIQPETGPGLKNPSVPLNIREYAGSLTFHGPKYVYMVSRHHWL